MRHNYIYFLKANHFSLILSCDKLVVVPLPLSGTIINQVSSEVRFVPAVTAGGSVKFLPNIMSGLVGSSD